ncbi:UNVERIFIED_CONTAM: hypothetical protein BEN50_26180 [Euhalothece sp. KZN 001]
MIALAACTSVDPQDAELVLKPASFEDLPGWEQDDHAAVLTAFERSCGRILKRDPRRSFGPDDIGGTYGDWHPPCAELKKGNIT